MFTKTRWCLPALLLVWVVTGYSWAESPPPAEPETAYEPAVTIAFELDEPVEFDLKSEPVIYRDTTFHLLSLVEAEFNLDDDKRLTASLKGGSTSFDDVEYTVHAAVFDAEGVLLGTASTPCRVQRIWVGVLTHRQAELELDFGLSKRYAEAANVILTISSMDVLTPDDWQE